MTETSEWEIRSLETLEICYLMVSLFQNWDLQHLRAVDPAVCIVGLSLFVCLHMHMFSRGVANASLREQLSCRKNIVRLFLQHYAIYWTLPQLLLGGSSSYRVLDISGANQSMFRLL